MSARPAAAVEADDRAVARDASRLLTEAGLAVARGRAPDAALLVLLPRGDAAERVERIVAAAGEAPGVALVAGMPGDAGARQMRGALHAGAHGIVLDGRLDTALVPTVQAVLAGQLVVPPALRRQLAPQALSHRERQILSLVAAGHTNRQIAGELFLAESTVKTHLSSAFAKLDVRSRAEAAALILDPDAGYGPAVVEPAAPTGRLAA